MKKLIVTASSKTKLKTDEIAFKRPDRTFYDSLATSQQKKFFNARSILLNEFGIEEGADTHQIDALQHSTVFLPAYKRYKGRTFSKVTPQAWENLCTQPEIDCVILSAFYGIIRYEEPIRNYAIRQDTKMQSGKEIAKFWKDQGASDWLFEYIKSNKIDEVKFVLSTSYSDIVAKEELMRKLKDELGITSEDKQFKEGGGMKSMILRGQYINDLLLNTKK